MSIEPVKDWTTDYDIFDPAYVQDPFPIWDELRQQCPVAHSDRHEGSWMPTRYADLFALARDVEHFSSREILVAPRYIRPNTNDPNYGVRAPPISSDPPEHTWSRKLLLPWFTVKAVSQYEEETRELCNHLIDKFIAEGRADAAVDYAQQIPPRVIAMMLGVSPDNADTFVGWVRATLEQGFLNPEAAIEPRQQLINFFREQVADRQAHPRENDIITYLLNEKVDGEPIPLLHILGTCLLLLVAGIDTTWSSIGSALWHLAQNPQDRARLVTEPGLMTSAVEELLRVYAPVTMARIVASDVEYNGCPMKAGDRLIMNFPAANRDPEKFENPDQVILDRPANPHIAFGVGIHRCAGSNLARMEMKVSLEEWLRRIPDFKLENPEAVTWAGGQVRGPRQLPVIFPRGGK
jgi:cytochrome P450